MSSRPMVAAGAALAIAGALGSATADAGVGPDLAVTRVGGTPARITQGGAFLVTDTTVVRGPGAPSVTRYHLSRDPRDSLAERRTSAADPRGALGDVLLAGARPVPRAGSTGRARVRVPVGTAPGRYWVLACADDTARVTERDERRNCRPARSPLVVAADPQATRVDGLSDAFAEPTEADDRAALEQVAPAACRVVAPRPAPSERQALAAIRAFLTRTAGAGALRAFAVSPDARSARAAGAASVQALAAGRPGAALAATLRAHELEPGRAAHLENAAALATAVGLPAPALALLDAAARRTPGALAPMGISRRSSVLAVRAAALQLLGRAPEAARAAALAEAAEPLLAEARTTHAAATACTAGPAAALPGLRSGRRRAPGIPRADVSGGAASPLRALPLPALPENAVAMEGHYRNELGELAAQSAALTAREQALQAEVRAHAQALPPAGRRRLEGVELLALSSHEGLAAQKQAIDHQLTLALDATAAIFGDGANADSAYAAWFEEASAICATSDCVRRELRARCIPPTRGVHQTVMDHVTSALRLSETYHRTRSAALSGYAANLTDPDAHARIMLLVELDEVALYGGLVQAIGQWSTALDHRREHCVSQPEPPLAIAASAAPAPVAAGQCPAWLAALSSKLELGDVTVKIGCEEVKLAGGLGKGWITAFGEVAYDVRAGRVTVFAGSKATTKLGPLKGDFKSGLYLVTGRDGIEDAGWRVGPTATVGAGPLEYKLGSDMEDISFVSVVSPLFE